jgi:hypothetical protein
MGNRLADTLAANLNGAFDENLELNPAFAASGGATTAVVEQIRDAASKPEVA